MADTAGTRTELHAVVIPATSLLGCADTTSAPRRRWRAAGVKIRGLFF